MKRTKPTSFEKIYIQNQTRQHITTKETRTFKEFCEVDENANHLQEMWTHLHFYATKIQNYSNEIY